MTTSDVALVERDATVLKITDIAFYLQEHLGQRIAAYMCGIRDAKMVGRWARGDHAPQEATKMRLRAAYQVTRLLVEAYDDETAKAWLFGMNSRLDDRAPGSVIRLAVVPDDLESVVPAARAFAGGAV